MSSATGGRPRSASRAVLLVIPHQEVAGTLEAYLARAGYETVVVASLSSLKGVLAERAQFSCAVVDVRFKDEDQGLKLVRLLRQQLPRATALLIADGVLAPAALKGLTEEGAARRLDASTRDPAAVERCVRQVAARALATVYDANVINCFVTSVNDVFAYYTSVQPELGQPGVAPSKRLPRGFAAVVVPFDGPACQGVVSLTCDKDLIAGMASRILGEDAGAPTTGRDTLIEAITALSDQIFGKTELLLGKIGLASKMGVPEVHVDDDRPVVTRAPAPMLLLPFRLTRQRLYVGFSLKRK